MNNNFWPALGVGTALVLFGAGYFRAQWRGRKMLAATPELDDRERAYLDRQAKRRMQISSMIIIVGVSIAVGDLLLPLQKFPIWTTLYWIGVLVLVMWIILLALGDLWVTSTHAKAALTRVRQKQQELERQIVEFKHRLDDGNGPR